MLSSPPPALSSPIVGSSPSTKRVETRTAERERRVGDDERRLPALKEGDTVTPISLGARGALDEPAGSLHRGKLGAGA